MLLSSPKQLHTFLSVLQPGNNFDHILKEFGSELFFSKGDLILYYETKKLIENDSVPCLYNTNTINLSGSRSRIRKKRTLLTGFKLNSNNYDFIKQFYTVVVSIDYKQSYPFLDEDRDTICPVTGLDLKNVTKLVKKDNDKLMSPLNNTCYFFISIKNYNINKNKLLFSVSVTSPLEVNCLLFLSLIYYLQSVFDRHLGSTISNIYIRTQEPSLKRSYLISKQVFKIKETLNNNKRLYILLLSYERFLNTYCKNTNISVI